MFNRGAIYKDISPFLPLSALKGVLKEGMSRFSIILGTILSSSQQTYLLDRDEKMDVFDCSSALEA